MVKERASTDFCCEIEQSKPGRGGDGQTADSLLHLVRLRDLLLLLSSIIDASNNTYILSHLPAT
jgi:hypothetical protein